MTTQRELPVEVMVQFPEELAACCDFLAQAATIGFDTEFVGEDSYHPHLCLIQVATADRLYLIDALTVGALDAFWKLLVDPKKLVVVHAGREEVRLCQRLAGVAPANLFDLQLAAGLLGMIYPLGHAALVQQVLGDRLTKAETLTDWRQRPLAPQQVRYAFDDVRFLLSVWQRLDQRLQALGREAWAREEFARLTAHPAPEEEMAQERWRRLRGIGGLNRRELAIVRALYAWRDEQAARANRPTRAILRDDLIVEIARRQPRRERDLQLTRGLPRRDLGAIIPLIEAARALPVEQCPDVFEREQDPPQVAMVSSIMQAVLADRCVRLQVAPNLAASAGDIKQLVRARAQKLPPPEDSPLLHGWRRDHVLPCLLDVLEGRRGVRIDDPSARAPLAYEEVRLDPTN